MPVTSERTAPLQNRLGSSDRASVALRESQPFDAVGETLLVDPLDLRLFEGVGGDDQFAAARMRNAVAFAEAVQHPAARDAVPGAEDPEG